MVRHDIVLSRPGRYEAEFYENLERAIKEKKETLAGFLMLDDVLISLIGGAKKTLDIMAPFQTNINERVLSEIENTIDMGTDVRILTRLPIHGQESVFQRTKILRSVRYFDHRSGGADKGSLHAKVVIRDREEAYFGSGELMETSLNTNLEIGMLTDDHSIVGLLNAVFNTAWELAD